MADEKKYYTFTVLEGEHQGFKQAYKKGETFQSLHPLDELFKGKFMRLLDSNIPRDIKPQGKSSDDGRLTFVWADADDVSDSFPLATKHKLKVYKDARGGYAIASELVKGVEPLNLAPSILGSKAQVTKFLTSYVESQLAD
jgi:hypothetical protein